MTSTDFERLHHVIDALCRTGIDPEIDGGEEDPCRVTNLIEQLREHRNWFDAEEFNDFDATLQIRLEESRRYSERKRS